MTNTSLILIVVVVIAAIAVLTFGYASRKRAQLKAQFGPEYDRTVRDVGNPRKAEALLEARARRVSRYSIRPLSPEEHQRFLTSWQQLQARFVDDPAGAVAGADVVHYRALFDGLLDVSEPVRKRA